MLDDSSLLWDHTDFDILLYDHLIFLRTFRSQFIDKQQLYTIHTHSFHAVYIVHLHKISSLLLEYLHIGLPLFLLGPHTTPLTFDP